MSRPLTLTCLLTGLALAGCGDNTSNKIVLEPVTTEPAQTEPADAGSHVRVLATGASFAGTNGIALSPDNKLYVASVVGSTISVLDPDTGEILRQMGPDEGVFGPDDVAFSPDGSVYWTAILTGQVAGMSPDGNRVEAAQLTPGVNPLTFSDDGRLFVAQCFFDTGLYEVDPAGINAPRLITDDLGPGCGLNGMDWGPDGRLYGPRWFHGEVVSVNVADGSRRVEATGFETPAAVKFDSQGRLHVLDASRGEVVRVEGETRAIVAALNPGLDNIAFDKDDRLFVSSFTDGFITRINPDGSQTQLQPGGISHAGGITTTRDGSQVLVADVYNVRYFDAATGEQTRVQTSLLGDQQGGAINIAWDGEQLIQTSWLNNAVRIWDPESGEITERYENLQGPVAAVRYGDDLIATEFGTRRVVKLNPEGPVSVFELPGASGLVVADDNLYATNRAEGQILQLGENNALLATPRILVEGLTTPEGISVADGVFYVMEGSTGAIKQVRPGEATTVLATFTPGIAAATPHQPDSMIFNGITVAGNTLYAVSENERQLHAIKLD